MHNDIFDKKDIIHIKKEAKTASFSSLLAGVTGFEPVLTVLETEKEIRIFFIIDVELIKTCFI